jgi:tRNA (Thr-GGU) A37 N-methylase
VGHDPSEHYLAPSVRWVTASWSGGVQPVEVIYLFDRVDPSSVCLHARRPRGNPAWPEIGIFAQRAKDRPNRLGLSTCELLGVEDRTIDVQGLDAVDGTPVLDVKPSLQEFAPRGSIRQAAWSTELMASYF